MREAVDVLGAQADLVRAALDARLGSVPRARGRAAARPTIWPTRLRGFSDACGSWKTIWISRRSAHRRRDPARGDVLPREADRAGRRASSRTRQRARVVLPQPDSPTSPSVSPLGDRERDVVDRLHLACDAVDHEPRWTGKWSFRCSTSSSGGPGRRILLGRGRDGSRAHAPTLAGGARESDRAVDEPHATLLLGIEPAAVAVMRPAGDRGPRAAGLPQPVEPVRAAGREVAA